MERRRFLFVTAIAVAPVAALIGFGCSDDEPGPVTRVTVDPGGTFGAEVAVTVVGRGRVTGNIASSIDCPTNCYVRYTFKDGTAPGAANGLGLKAIPTPGARFAGWRFEPDELATKGRGPDNCNPIKRAAAQPAVDATALEISLPFGETAGTPPAGQEGSCGGDFAKVPVAYKLVATFEDIPIPDAGFDADDGGPGELLYEAPAAGATGGELGLVSGRLYWKYTVGGLNGIASGMASSGSTTPTVLVSPSSVITRFETDTQNAVYQTSGGAIAVFSNGSSFPNTSFTGGPASCDAIEPYQSTIYCVSGGTLYSWPNTGGTATLLLTGAPQSTKNFAVDASYFYFVDDSGGAGNSSIVRMSKFDANGDAGTFTPIVTGETNPIRLHVGSYLFWIQYSTASQLGELRSASTSGGTPYTSIPAQSGLTLLAPDYSSTYVIGGIVPPGGPDARIVRGYAFGSSTTTLVSGIRTITGIAADSTYVYWTQNDGRVYRHFR